MTPRVIKSEQEKAAERVAVAERKVTRLRAVKATHQAAINLVVPEIEAAEAQLAYLLANPALKTAPTQAAT